MRTTNADAAEVAEFVLSGREFTYMEACAALSIDADKSRVIDRALQKLRRKGVIEFVRIRKRGCVWKKTSTQQAQGHGVI